MNQRLCNIQIHVNGYVWSLLLPVKLTLNNIIKILSPVLSPLTVDRIITAHAYMAMFLGEMRYGILFFPYLKIRPRSKLGIQEAPSLTPRDPLGNPVWTVWFQKRLLRAALEASPGAITSTGWTDSRSTTPHCPAMPDSQEDLVTPNLWNYSTIFRKRASRTS